MSSIEAFKEGTILPHRFVSLGKVHIKILHHFEETVDGSDKKIIMTVYHIFPKFLEIIRHRLAFYDDNYIQMRTKYVYESIQRPAANTNLFMTINRIPTAPQPVTYEHFKSAFLSSARGGFIQFLLDIDEEIDAKRYKLVSNRSSFCVIGHEHMVKKWLKERRHLGMEEEIGEEDDRHN